MGNTLNVVTNSYDHYKCPKLTPGPYEKPTFESSEGFRSGRKEREMIATEAQMRSAKIRLKDRDYCAHLLLKLLSCRRDVWPFTVKCEHQMHEYHDCQYDDFVLRMKEYERERRLRVREAQKA